MNVLASELAKLKEGGQNAVLIDQLVSYLGTLPTPDERDRHFEWTKHTTSLQHPSATKSYLEPYTFTCCVGETAL